MILHLSLEQARSDVLADLALGRITLDDEPTGRSHGGAVIAVTVPVTSLAGLTDEPGITFDGELALPAELVRELAAEPGTLFHRLLTDPAGRVLDVTELGRFPSERLRLGVQARDGTCAFSTCSGRPISATSTTRSRTHAARRAARISARCVAGTTGSSRTDCSRVPLPHHVLNTGSLRSRWTGSRLDPVASWTRCSRSTRT